MKSLIALLIGFTTLVCVNAIDQDTYIKLQLAKYVLLPNWITRALIRQDNKAIKDMMYSAADQYDNEDLYVIAIYYRKLKVYVDPELENMFTELNDMSWSQSKVNYIKLGVTVAVIRWRAELEKESRASNPLIVTNTSANLEIKFQELCNKTISRTDWTTEELKKKESNFYSRLHGKIANFLREALKRLYNDIKALDKEDVRAKNFQLAINDINLLLSVADARNEEETT